jgi:cytosine/adenosine deaminase-related metal-dependent hydrolase
MTVYRAMWICPIDRPAIRDGWIAVEDGRIVAVGEAGEPAPGGAAQDLGATALLPGLINAHTHLELSWLRGRVPPATSFVQWMTRLFALRRRPERIDDLAVRAAAADAAGEARDTGTVAVGDISNSLAAVDALIEAGLDGLVFHEFVGFNERDGRLVDETAGARRTARERGARVSLAPHAPYSVSTELFQAIRAAVDRWDPPITSVHLAESREEVEMLVRGTGPWPGMLRAVGAWREGWQAPGVGPVEYLDRMGIIDGRTLVVHAVQVDDAALERLAERGATVVTCPRSNQWVGVGAPPVQRFYRSGVNVAVGTDSLASAADLNLFGELEAMRWLAPDVPARELLKSATLVGARALGLDAQLGTLAPGKRATVAAVTLAGPVSDVEEYLVGGIEPPQVELLTL